MNKIAIFLPSRSTNVLKSLETDGVGAREQIADWLARKLADKNEVHVFTNLEESRHEGNLHWVDQQEMAAGMLLNYEWDALVSFDFPSVASLPDIKKTVKRLVVAQNYFEIPPEGYLPEVFDLVDTWVFPSEFALKECSRVNATDPAKGIVIPYAVDEELYSGYWKKHETLRFIYANQAESGLAQTLRMWPEIRAAYPDSVLTVATPVDEFVEQIQWSHSIQSELALDIRDLIGQEGVRYIGRQNPADLAKEFYGSDILLYPAEPISPSEIGSLPVLQAASAGVVPIFTPADALEELYQHYGMMAPVDKFMDAIEYIVNELDDYRDNVYSVAHDPSGSADMWRQVLGC